MGYGKKKAERRRYQLDGYYKLQRYLETNWTETKRQNQNHGLNRKKNVMRRIMENIQHTWEEQGLGITVDCIVYSTQESMIG